LKAKFGVDAVTAGRTHCARCHPQARTCSGRTFDFSYRRKYGDSSWNGGEISRENFYAADHISASISRDPEQGQYDSGGRVLVLVQPAAVAPDRHRRTPAFAGGFGTVTQTLTKGTVVS